MTIGIERVNDYPQIRFEIRFERKFPIRRSLQESDTENNFSSRKRPGNATRHC